ncbi:transglycosylase domain-containing protein [Paenibacillus sp. CC-CFT747]|nr:transglycosylase domain-containing protein [Paenibacillus sp. CC-CFT747]
MNLPRTVKRPARRQRPKLRTIVVPGTRKRVPLWKTKRLWLSLSAGVLLLLLVTGGLAAMAVSKLDVTKAGYPLPDPTNVYDRNGKAVAQFSSSKVEPVALDRIPLDLRNAVIATEDRRFYEHSGVDVQSLMRALWRDVRSQSFAEGGSTITQQLAKNLFLQSDKTLSRKFKEAGYALKIDLTYDKDEILELYLNSIYFGEGTWGVQGAAKVYFNKKVEDLTLEECAMLAALPKAPSRYSPYRDRAAALERRNVVLSLMKDQNFITGEAYAKAQAMPIAVRKPSEEETKDKYPSFVDYVLREAESVYGFTEDQIRNGGLEIYTTLDPVVQEAAEEVYRTDSFFPASKPDQLIQSGAAIVDHHDGSIRGLVGHRGEGVVRGFNYATQLVRQPGSAFKPLAVYGPALEKGYTPQSILFDGPLDIGGYQPRDWDNQTRGT